MLYGEAMTPDREGFVNKYCDETQLVLNPWLKQEMLAKLDTLLAQKREAWHLAVADEIKRLRGVVGNMSEFGKGGSAVCADIDRFLIEAAVIRAGWKG